MSGKEEGVTKEEIGVLRSGKIFQYSRKRTVDDREGQHNEVEESDTDIVLQIEGILCIERKEKEQDLQIIPTEGYLLRPISLTQVKPTMNPRPHVHL